MTKVTYCKCREYRTFPFYCAPPFSSTTTKFSHSRFTELCTMLLTKSITYLLTHAPFCSLFLNQSAHHSLPENLHCATCKKNYLLPHSCTSLFTSSVVEMVFVMFSNNAQCKKWECVKHYSLSKYSV